MFCDFDAVFHPENRWKDKKLTTLNPCRNCDTYKKYIHLKLHGTIAERQDTELPDSCRVCVKRLSWEMDCMTKLIWYENNDKSLK